MQYAVVHQATHVVVNLILWDGQEQDGAPPFADAFPGHDLIAVPVDAPASIGGLYEDGSFSAPVVEMPPVPAPTSVSMRQARLALLTAGKLADVKTAIDALPGDEGEAARIEWEFAATVERDSPIVAMLAQVVGLDADALDALFLDAATR